MWDSKEFQIFKLLFLLLLSFYISGHGRFVIADTTNTAAAVFIGFLISLVASFICD